MFVKLLMSLLKFLSRKHEAEWQNSLIQLLHGDAEAMSGLAWGRRDDSFVLYSADGVAHVYISILRHCPGVYPLISDDSGDIVLGVFFHPLSERPKNSHVRWAAD